MAIQQQQQEVNVTAQAAQVSVDADSNASQLYSRARILMRFRMILMSSLRS